MSDQEMYDAFYQVASRCGYQFSALCNPEYFIYRETEILWEFFKMCPSHVIEFFLNYEVAMTFLGLHYDMEARNYAYENGISNEEMQEYSMQLIEKYCDELKKYA